MVTSSGVVATHEWAMLTDNHLHNLEYGAWWTHVNSFISRGHPGARLAAHLPLE